MYVAQCALNSHGSFSQLVGYNLAPPTPHPSRCVQSLEHSVQVTEFSHLPKMSDRLFFSRPHMSLYLPALVLLWKWAPESPREKGNHRGEEVGSWSL